MDIYIYSDESGVFDKVHNSTYVFGGILFLSKQQRDICSRKYSHAEAIVSKCENAPANKEIKACKISNKAKGKLYRSLNSEHKFAVIVDQDRILPQIYISKKDKQRYLDYAYKIGIKRKFQNLISNGIIIPDQVERLRFYIDEHTTATNGRYELKEGLEMEFKWGTYNEAYSIHYPPIFPNLRSIELDYYNSASMILIRAADIIVNNVYHRAINGDNFSELNNNLHVAKLP